MIKINYKFHFSTGLFVIGVYLIIITNYFNYNPGSIRLLTVLFIGVIASLLPDIDTKSRIRNMVQPVLLILAIGFAFINLFVTGLILFVIICYHWCSHRGAFHSYPFNLMIAGIIAYTLMDYFAGISYAIGFITHKILDKI